MNVSIQTAIKRELGYLTEKFETLKRISQLDPQYRPAGYAMETVRSIKHGLSNIQRAIDANMTAEERELYK